MECLRKRKVIPKSKTTLTEKKNAFKYRLIRRLKMAKERVSKNKNVSIEIFKK